MILKQYIELTQETSFGRKSMSIDTYVQSKNT